MARSRSSRSIDAQVARMPGVIAAVAKAGESIADRARLRLETIPKRRTGQSRIEIHHGKVDTYVSLVDPAALAIEFGHISNRTGKYLPGLYIIRGAVHKF